MTFRVLVTDGVDQEGVSVLTAEPSLVVDEIPVLPHGELLARVHDYDAIVGRSAMKITEELLQRATRLRVVGRAGVGVDNIAVDLATALGIAVINAPAGNTTAVAELFFGSVIGLMRHIPDAHQDIRAGKWERSRYLGRELQGKSLGLVGLGPIGSEVAQRAAAFGMTVRAYDPFVADERFAALRVQRADSLQSLLETTQILSLHVPLTDQTRGMIGARELALLPPQSVVVNLARGGIVDEMALCDALQGGHLRGAVLDVYEKEPLPADHPLRTAPHLLLTPHLGANTVEAQRNVARDVCRAVRDFLLRQDLSRSINVSISAGAWAQMQPAIGLARRAATVARTVLADRGEQAVKRATIRAAPEIVHAASALVAATALGLLEGVVETERLNLINARQQAELRGIEIAVAESADLGHPRAVEITVHAGTEKLSVAGIVTDRNLARLTRIGNFHVDVSPRQTLLVLTNRDVPGVIGAVGTLLGSHHVNIAEYHQARLAQGGEALAAISVDDTVGEQTRLALLELPDILSASVVHFPAE